MTDFFTLFDQPRQPWLKPEIVKEKYHRLTRVAHPDAGARPTDIKFEEVNEAYRVLSDPKLRIEYLLTLEGHPPATTNRVPSEDLQSLFLQIGTLSQKSQRLLARTNERSAIARSLVEGEVLELRSQIQRLLLGLMHSYETCLVQLEELNESWHQNRSMAVLQLQTLHDRISYLSRWTAQLKEIQFRLGLRD
jgi:curved DNA-binding protein CbpA